jgi:hypothetical protein
VEKDVEEEQRAFLLKEVCIAFPFDLPSAFRLA